MNQVNEAAKGMDAVPTSFLQLIILLDLAPHVQLKLMQGTLRCHLPSLCSTAVRLDVLPRYAVACDLS